MNKRLWTLLLSAGSIGLAVSARPAIAQSDEPSPRDRMAARAERPVAADSTDSSNENDVLERLRRRRRQDDSTACLPKTRLAAGDLETRLDRWAAVGACEARGCREQADLVPRPVPDGDHEADLVGVKAPAQTGLLKGWNRRSPPCVRS